MYHEDLFRSVFVYLCAAAISVPIAKRFGLSSVLGYLVAGIVIGNYGLGLVGGGEEEDVMHFAEFGVVLMLFLVGLELQPSLLWKMRGPILGLGGLQVTVTALAIFALTLAFFDLSWQEAFAIGLTLSLSSTAIVLQSLNEKNLMKTVAGRSSFSVLLFQDIAVIPMLAAFPLLATMSPAGGKGDHGHGEKSAIAEWIDHLPAWGNALLVLGAVAAIIILGRTVVRWLLKFIGGAHVRETFVAFALILVIGTALLMNSLGVSPALGAFLAGVVLATSEYRHQLESDLDPFKGLLLGAFFIAVGAGINFSLIRENLALIAGLVVGLMLLKGIILWLLGRFFRIALDQRNLFAFGLAQAGEFGFVLLGFATGNGVIDLPTGQILISVVALTMAMTPLVMLFEEKVLRSRIGIKASGATDQDDDDMDDMDEDAPVILVGFGRFGNHVGRFLRSQGIRVTVLDHDSNHIDFLRKIGIEAFYGDASRVDLLEAAGANKAKILIITLREEERIKQLVEVVQQHFPHLQVFSRAYSRVQQYELVEDHRIEHAIHEHSHSSVELGIRALEALGVRRHTAVRAGRDFLQHEDESVRQLAGAHQDGERSYIQKITERLEDMESTFGRAKPFSTTEDTDRAWNSDAIREGISKVDKPEN